MSDYDKIGLPHTGSEEDAMLEISVIRFLTQTAGLTVRELWDERRKTFWRNTEQRARETITASQTAFYPTVTFRCVSALLECVMVSPDWCDSDLRTFVLEGT